MNRFLAAALVLALHAPVSAEVNVYGGHPRIFYTAEQIPNLVARCRPGGVVSDDYVAMKADINRFIDEKRAMNGNNLPALCIVYQVEKALGNDVTRYVDFLVKGLWGTDGKGGGSNLQPGDMWVPNNTRGTILDGYMGGRGNWFSWDAMALDWFHDALTEEQRLLYGNLIGQWMHSFMGLKPEQPAEITLKWGNYLYNQTWGGHGNNWSRDGVSSKTYVALVLAGEGTDYEESIDQWLESWDKMVPNEFLPAIERQGGAWVAGPGHGGGTARQVMLVLQAWRSATGENLFPHFRSGGLRELAWWPVFAEMPHNGWWPHQNDTGAGMSHSVGRLASTYGPVLASAYGQPQAQWLTSRYSESDDGSWVRVLWYDPEVRAADVSEFPTAYLFQGSGQTYIRSGWTGADDTWAYFVSGPHYVGYQSPEDGAFQIYKGGGLAMRGGTDRYSGVRPTSMNAVLVYNPDEKVEGRRGRNDGGVLGNPGAPLEPVERGHVSAFQHTDPFTYATADLSGAYDSSKVEGYTRQLLYLRSDPECFVVYDRVTATKPEFPKLWQLHVMNEPVFYAGDKRLSDGNSEPGYRAFGEADQAVTSNYTPSNNPAANGRDGEFRSSGFGAMLTTRLLPERSTMAGRGGEGHDNWGNPFNPEDDKNIEGGRGEGRGKMDRSWWRIEVTPDDASKATEFLHVLAPILVSRDEPKTAAELSLDAFPRIVRKAVTKETVGFVVQQGTSSWEVILNRTGSPGGSVYRRADGAPDGKWELVESVQPVKTQLGEK